MKTHLNNIGFLRLIFASLVIIGHSPEIIDGDRSREPLTVIFHTISLGDFAVDAFFLLSGYLITKSAAGSSPISVYMQRRIMRIVPAFLVSFLICVFVIGPMFGAEPWKQMGLTVLHLLTLQLPPHYQGQTVSSLNGAMWSIAYEFRCYLLVLVFRMTGLLKRPAVCLALTAVLLGLTIACSYPAIQTRLDSFNPFHVFTIIGETSRTIRLSAIFLVGMMMFLYWPAIAARLNGVVAGACALAAFGVLFVPHFAEAGLAIFGGFALFWLSLKANLGPLQRVNDSWDISYGTYLYGWPVAIILLALVPTMTPGMMAAVALPLAMALGFASWWGVEKWTKDFVPYRPRGYHARTRTA